MAKAQMDNIKRRDPKNINNKFSLAQLRELTPSIEWDVYLKAVNAPASEHYIVTSPDFFRAENKLLEEHPLEHWKILYALAGDSPLRTLLNQSDGRRKLQLLRSHLGWPGGTTSALAALHALRPTAIWAKPWARPMSIALFRQRARRALSKWCMPSKAPCMTTLKA